MTELSTVKIAGGRIVEGRELVRMAMHLQRPVVAEVDGELELILPLKADGGRVTAVRFGEFDVNVLPTEEAVRCFFEGVEAQRAGKQFHEGPYARPGEGVGDDEYQRGYEWRKGWNEAALGRV